MVLTISCRRVKWFVGKKEKIYERDTSDQLIKKTIIKKKSNSILLTPHSPAIIKTKIWKYENGKLIEFTMEKRKRTIKHWEGELLKTKKRSY